MSLSFGVYDISIELHLAELAYIVLARPSHTNEHLEFVDILINMLMQKLAKKCGLILLMDYDYDYFLRVIGNIFTQLATRYYKEEECNPLIVDLFR